MCKLGVIVRFVLNGACCLFLLVVSGAGMEARSQAGRSPAKYNYRVQTDDGLAEDNCCAITWDELG